MRWFLPPHLFAACVIVMIAFDRFLLPGDFILYPWKYAGILFVLGGLALNVTAAVTFKRLKTNIIPFRDPDRLVDEGPFRHTRNPMYLGFSVILFGIAIYLGSIGPFLAVPVFVAIADRWYIPDEEKRMKALFGAQYDAYRARVRRWV
ncbi:methyltransferase family protein [Minwuia sp.]|uniref:methyltransferase family protein n=1 Tax=Minwuia sp. TaxID=2493630 RepID=UPI003A912BE9